MPDDLTSRSSGVDFFICHASEDKDRVARPLADALSARGFRVWYDEYSLSLGDSLRRSIDRGIGSCRFGIVILSPWFFAKHWPQRELDGLVSREVALGAKLILPIWHDVSEDEVRANSPPLADKLAVSTSGGLDFVVNHIARVIDSHPQRNRYRWKRRPIPKFPSSILADTSRELRGKIARILVYYDFDACQRHLEPDKRGHEVRFSEVIQAAEAGRCLLGLGISLERQAVDFLLVPILVSLDQDPSIRTSLRLTREVSPWVAGVYAEWKCKLPPGTPSLRVSLDFDLGSNDRRFELRFWKGDTLENVTLEVLHSNSFERIDAGVREAISAVLKLMNAGRGREEAAIERFVIDEDTNEGLGERGIDIPPAIIYVWD